MKHTTYKNALDKLGLTGHEVAALIGFAERTSRRYAESPKYDQARRVHNSTAVLLQLMLDGCIAPIDIQNAREGIRRADQLTNRRKSDDK